MAYPHQQPTQPFTGQVPTAYQFQQSPQGQQYQPQPEADPYAPTAWGQLADFTCPSGQRCALRPLDLEQLLAMGVLEDINALTGIVEKDVIRPAQGLPPINTEKILRDGKKVGDIMRVVDQIVVTVVAKPEIRSNLDANGNRLLEGQRELGVVYVDSISLVDRIAIFNESLKGVSELESFRQAAGQPGGSVADQPSVAHPA